MPQTMTSGDAPIRLEVLGALRVSRAGGEDTGLTGLPALLFVYLADRGVPVSRAQLTALFWPDVEASRGRHGLRQALSRIRQAVGPELVVGTDPVGLAAERIDADTELFTSALEAGDIGRALRFWRGPFLTGDADGVGWELAEWVEVRRRELEALLLDAGRGGVRALMGAEKFEDALALVERLEECAPGEAGLAMDAAELLLELGRPNEAVVRLEAVGLESGGHPRAEGILRQAARVEPQPIERNGALAPAAAGEELPSHPTSEPKPASSRRRRIGIAAAVIAVLAVAGWAVRPLPLPEATVHFCAQREVMFGFALRLPAGVVDGVVIEPACPLVPLGEDSLLVFRSDGEGGMEAIVQIGFEDRIVYRNAGQLGPASVPFRRVGPRDGVVSPDGRQVLLAVERRERPRERDLTLPALPEENAVPGVPGIRSDPSSDWDVVLLDLVTGEERSIGPPEDNVRDGRFTPDGQSVVYVNDATGNGDLYRLDLAAGETVRLTSDPRMARAPSIGREHIVFWLGAGTDEDPEDVAVLDRATGEVRLLHPEPWNQAGPKLSPDERRVCWTSKRLGHFEGDIVVADIDGSDRPRVFRSPGRDDGCQWLGSDHVLFTSWRAAPNQLFVQGLRPWSRAKLLTVWDGEIGGPVVSLGR